MFLIRIFTYLPFWFLHGLSNVFAFLLDKVVRYRRKVAEDNLRHAFPTLSGGEISKLRKQFYLHFTDLWMETLKGLSMPESEYRKRVKLENPELLLKFTEQGRPVMVLTSHRSNWEWLTPSHSLLLPVPIDAVYKRVKSDFFDQLMHQIRSRFGARMVEKKNLLRDSIQRNKIPRILAIMFDQSPQKRQNNRWYTFMNRPTPFYNASEKLATKLNMPVVFADMDRVSRGHYTVKFHLITDQPATLSEGSITKAYIRLTEQGIYRRPADYLWTHKRWKLHPLEEWQKAGDGRGPAPA
jgi:KDO2-lipid IV(A) lauroyltransferase